MLTFEQALLMLKSGEDVLRTTWARGMFVRAMRRPTGPALVLYHGTTTAPYAPTDQDLFANDWSKA